MLEVHTAQRQTEYGMQGTDVIDYASYSKAKVAQIFINVNTMISLGRQETAFDFFR
jgi:hypothetical protein